MEGQGPNNWCPLGKGGGQSVESEVFKQWDTASVDPADTD